MVTKYNTPSPTFDVEIWDENGALYMGYYGVCIF